MSVVQSVEEVGPCRKEVAIEVPPAAVEAEIERAVAGIRRKVKVPGFRPGKAPSGLVRQRYREDIEETVSDALVPRYWRQAEAELQIEPLLPPQLKDLDFSFDERTMRFVAVVETRPEIPLGDLEAGAFTLPEPPVEPTQEEIDRQLDDLARRAGTWGEVERPAARGDRVRVTVGPQGEEGREITFEVGEPQVWEELSLAVTGLGPGQHATFRRGSGEEASEHRVEVVGVEELEPAPRDDELAKKVSRFETLAELEESVAKMIRSAKDRDRRREREKALLEQLRERYPVALPRGVVEKEIESMLHEYAHELAHQGVDLERTQIDWGELGERVRPQAEASVHSRLVLDAVAEEQKLGVSEEKLERILQEMARQQKTSALSVRRKLDEQGRLGDLRRRLRRQAAVEWLMGEEDEEEAAAAGSEG